jgi:hypothetical protein
VDSAEKTAKSAATGAILDRKLLLTTLGLLIFSVILDLCALSLQVDSDLFVDAPNHAVRVFTSDGGRASLPPDVKFEVNPYALSLLDDDFLFASTLVNIAAMMLLALCTSRRKLPEDKVKVH